MLNILLVGLMMFMSKYTKKQKSLYHVNMSNINEEFKRYEPIAVWCAKKVYLSSNSLPNHIKDEFVQEAKYSLVKTLNSYNKKYKNKHLKRVNVKNEVIWRCLDHLSQWWVKTYCGCKTWITQKKYELYPQNIDDNSLFQLKLDQIEEDEQITEEVARHDEQAQAKQITEHYRKKLKLKKDEWDCLLFTYTQYNVKYPNKLTEKQHDNEHQRLKKALIKLIRR